MANSTKNIFLENSRIINELAGYSPTDDCLLSIPQHINAADPIFQFTFGLPQNPDVNYFLITLNLLNYLQSVNRILSKAYAAHQYIMQNRDKPSDTQIDLEALMIAEYSASLREFVSMLRVAIDQFIILLTTNSSQYPHECESIGDLVQKYPETDFLTKNIKFLIGLNAAANYLKHHPYQFEGPGSTLSLRSASLLIVASKSNKRRSFDYENIKKYFADQLTNVDDHHASCWIDCDFLVMGFNKFYEAITRHAQLNTRITP